MFLKNLFGGSEPKTISYFDAFFGLAMSLSRSIPLPEWATGTPESYNQREAESVDFARSRLRYATASRFVEEPLEKLLGEIGLINLARELRAESYEDWGEELPVESLEPIVSTYLKAWLCKSNPFVLLELAGVLVQAGRTAEAGEAVKVALKFPTHARTMVVNQYELVAQALAYELFPPGPSQDARSIGQTLNSPQTLALLHEEAERIQQKLDGIEAGKG